MDCSTCRSLFSSSFDGRLAGERRQEFTIHVQACAPCESEFALYRRVFSTVRGLPDGDAPPFRVPNEVPGSLWTANQSNRFSHRPRFARAAAGLLLFIGLVGTHVAVFQWSRENASTDRKAPTTASTATVLQADPVALLPASLRDHVEATDLFIKTAAQAARLPGENGARELTEADWAYSDLARLNGELRGRTYSGTDRAQIEAYLARSEDFVKRVRTIVDGHYCGNSVRAICDAASQSQVARDLDGMKPIVAALPLGTSYARMPEAPVVIRLSDDCRAIMDAKKARLGGQLPRALRCFETFEKKFKGSRYSTLARYLKTDTLMAAQLYQDAREEFTGMNPGPNAWVAQFSAQGELQRVQFSFVSIVPARAGQWCFPKSAQMFTIDQPGNLPMKAPSGIVPVTPDAPPVIPK